MSVRASAVRAGTVAEVSVRGSGHSQVSVYGLTRPSTAPHSGKLHGAAVSRRAAARVAKRR